MKIAHIVPGSGGGFYCENCMRDGALVRAQRGLGHDVLMIPMYLPLFVDDPGASEGVPVFFGGINCYLQQQIPLFRKTPRWLDRLWDASWMLKLAAKRAGSTRASALTDMTVSMIRGENGNQAKELDRLVQWLAGRERPQVIHLSNALLIGLAGRLRRELGARVVCTLQDEDTWIDAMGEASARRCWEAIRERTVDVDAFVAVSRYYAEFMTQRLNLPAAKVHIVHVGTPAEGHAPAALSFDPPVLGFLSRMSAAQGLDRLADAFLALKAEPRFKALRLRITGGMTGDDRRFLAVLKRRFTSSGVAGDVEFVEDFGRASRLAFLNSLSILSVPAPEGEAFGLFAVEAMASGVPVVEPRVGAFPELIEASGAGLLYDPAERGGLPAALRALLLDPERAREMGRRGRKAFLARFTVEHSAAALMRVYEGVARGGET